MKLREINLEIGMPSTEEAKRKLINNKNKSHCLRKF
jgi:hypothetical protein